ncbi:MAG: STT3 domain-containing protein [Candidatus Omnitrophota bacterium]
MINKKIFLIVSLGFVLALNLYVRSFPVYFPQLKTQARDIIESAIQKGTMEEVYKKFPQFYPLAKDEIKKSKMDEYKRLNRKSIDKQIEDLYAKMKDRYQDDSGQTYIMELDCWHWTRYVDNILKTGHPGDQVIDGAQWDMFMLAPLGWKILWDNLLYYLAAFLYGVFSVFHKVPLLTFLFYLPLFFISVFTIVLYSVSFRYGRYLGAVLTCLFIGMTPVFIPRSCAGWFDKDILSMMFPVAIFGSYISALVAGSFRKRLLWTVFTAFLVGLFAFAWTFWWFIFVIIVFYEVLSLAHAAFFEVYLSKKGPAMLKERSILLAVFVFAGFLWAIALAGTEPVIELYNQVRLALIFNKPLMTSIWPNVYSTVGEMRKTSIAEMARSVGGTQGMWLVAISALCMAVLFVRSFLDKKCEPFKRASISILVIWLAAMVFATTRGVRFVMFLSPPLGISFGWAASDLYRYLKGRNKMLGVVCAGLILAGSGTVLINNGYSAARSSFPLMDDGWYKVLNLMKEKTPPDTIVNSWWDFGDWFKVVAGRRVIFDGQSQGTPQAYWMAKALLTDDENRAVSILRMLNNGGNEAFNAMDRNIKNPLLSALLLEGIMVMPPDKAQATLAKFLPPSFDRDEVMRILFAAPPRACFVVDNSMPFKIGAISFLGNWDFSKVYIAQNFNKQEKGQIIEYLKGFGRDEQDLQRFYQEVFLISTKKLDDWLSHRLQFYSGLMDGREKDGIVYFENGFAYNPKDNSLQSGNGQIPRSLFLQVGDDIVESVYPKPNIICSLLIFRTESGYKCIMLDRELGRSIFVRLYFMRGKGLKHFVPFIDAEEGNSYIRVFGIAW